MLFLPQLYATICNCYILFFQKWWVQIWFKHVPNTILQWGKSLVDLAHGLEQPCMPFVLLPNISSSCFERKIYIYMFFSESARFLLLESPPYTVYIISNRIHVSESVTDPYTIHNPIFPSQLIGCTFQVAGFLPSLQIPEIWIILWTYYGGTAPSMAVMNWLGLYNNSGYNML